MKPRTIVSIFSLLCWCGLFHSAIAQTAINGKVDDQQTGEPISFCNITDVNSSTGTASNELGEFVISVETLPTKLIFSHIGYAPVELTVTSSEDLTIELLPLTTVLEGVTVTASANNKYALELAKKAFKKANEPTYKSKYGKAFFRQKSKNGAEYSEFSEIIYDIRYNAKGIEDWDILEGRYALRKGGVHNRNYTLLSRLLTPVQPATDDIIFPLHPGQEAYYEIKIINNIISNDHRIAVVWFKPRPSSRTPIFEGEVYIDTKTYDILKVKGKMSRDDLKLVQLMDKNGSWKNYSISYEIAYRPDGEQNPVLDYIKVDNEFDYYKNDSLIFHSSATSTLTFFEHYTPTSKKKLGGQFKGNRSDWQKLDEIGYNRKFWEENPIVKRTPVEKEVIDAFESDQAFGSIFLNSKDQVELVQSAIAGDPFIQELGTSINLYNNYNPIEKVYLHTDNSIFTAGENLWYAGYAVLGAEHNFSSASGMLHVDLIDRKNKILVSQTQALLNGKTSGSIALPSNLTEGTYQLRAYTDWMRNFDHDHFFYKTIKVLNPKKNRVTEIIDSRDEIDLQFFPEGGHTVVGLTGLVAFKAIGSDGLARKIKGRITDSKGKFTATLNSLTRGSGFFYLKPEAGEQYKAILDDGTVYPIPTALEKGYVMTVNNTNPKSIRVKIQATAFLKDSSFYIIGHIRNKKIYQGRFEFGQRSTVSFEIPKGKIPSGVMTLTLLGTNKKPWCERAIFVNNQDNLVISARVGPAQFGRRDEIRVDIGVSDADGRPVSTELSLAVTDLDQTTKYDSSGNILTHLLLQSDIKGHIASPGLLFRDHERTTVHTLDLVMLTNGWRRFPWRETTEELGANKKFPFTKGLTLSGVARNINNKPLANASLNIVAKTEEQIGMLPAITSTDGTFSIPDFNFRGETELVFNAFRKDERPVDVRVTLDPIKTTVPQSRFMGPMLTTTTEEGNFSAAADIRKRSDSLFHFNNTTRLDEVVVTENMATNQEPSMPSTLGQTPDATLYTKDTHETGLSLMDFVSRFAGVTVTGSFPYITVSVRGGGAPLWILNGVPVSNSLSELKPSVPNQIASMDISNVQRVELLKGPAAAIWGSRKLPMGSFWFIPKEEGAQKPKQVLSPSLTVVGHAVEKEFYSPKYSTKLEEHNAPDYRSTLYWNSSFTTDENGKASLKFFNSDNAKKLQVAIEGLSIYGTPGTYLRTFDGNE